MGTPGTAVIRLAERAVRAAQDQPWSPPGRPAVLIVDPDPLLAADLRRHLGGAYRIAGCSSPGEALGLLATERFAAITLRAGPALSGLQAAARRAGCLLLALPLSRLSLDTALAAARAP